MKIILAMALIVLFASPARADAQKTLSDMEIDRMAANKYASGELPLGDGHYVTDAPRKGYIYLCHAPNTMEGPGGGAQLAGEWIHGASWNSFAKLAVQGDVLWPNAQFIDTPADANHILIGNGLPAGHATGIFPVQQSDPAFAYDRNPNAIAAQKINLMLPRDPAYSDTPYCMGMESGVMLTGVPIFNGFDAGLRDAAAHELQDKCDGHPQRNGQYHYHSLSACMKDIGEKTVLGYALDGFPITGPLVAPGRYLTTENLDECHGITSEIVENGAAKITYHYVMTQDFPYSVSCFRAHPVRLRVSDITRTGQGPVQQAPMNNGGNATNAPPQMMQQQGVTIQRGGMQGGPPSGPQGSGPPPEALAACSGHADGSPCTFHAPQGPVSGNCQAPQGKPLACAPGWLRE